MIELLMCISLICFNKHGDYRFAEFGKDKYVPIVYEVDEEMNAGTFEIYDRYRVKYNESKERWACYQEGVITMRDINFYPYIR